MKLWKLKKKKQGKKTKKQNLLVKIICVGNKQDCTWESKIILVYIYKYKYIYICIYIYKGKKENMAFLKRLKVKQMKNGNKGGAMPCIWII